MGRGKQSADVNRHGVQHKQSIHRTLSQPGYFAQAARQAGTMVNYARHIRPAFERLWSTAKHWALQAAGRAWFCSDYLCWTVRGRCWLATVVGAFVLHVQRVRRGISTNQSSREQNEYEIVSTFDWLPKQLNGQSCPWGCSEEIDIYLLCIYVLSFLYIFVKKSANSRFPSLQKSAPQKVGNTFCHTRTQQTQFPQLIAN